MFDRHAFGDLALAVLLALPLASLARSHSTAEKPTHATAALKTAVGGHNPANGRIGLLG